MNPSREKTNDPSQTDISNDLKFEISESFVESGSESTRKSVSAAASASTVTSTEPVLPRFDDASDRTIMNLAHKSAMIVEAFPDRIPNARELEDMTNSFGLDLVSMALTKIISGVSPNKFFLERVDRVYRDIQLGIFEAPVVPVEERAELCIIESVDALTPKAKWGAHVETWRSWGRRAGLTTDVIQTVKGNSLMANAEVIRRELALQPHDRRIIASVGQGSAEFRLLLEQLLKTAPQELEGIQMWVNVAGFIRGGSGVQAKRRGFWDRKMLELASAVRGWPRTITHQLSSSNPRLMNEPQLQGLPFVCVSMVGFPSVTDVPSGMKGTYLNMAKRGPNDGLATFHESILRPGYIVPVPGMSHRAEPEKLGPWFRAVLSSFAFDRETRPRDV